MEIYGLYDLKNKEQCLIVDTLVNIKEFLNLTARAINRALRGELIKGRYEIKFCFKE